MFRIRGFFSIFLLIFSSGYSFAQSTIFNIPSTDIQSKGNFYIEGDFISHFDRFPNGGFQSYGYRTVYGVGKNFEAGVNFFYTRNGSRPAPKQLQPNFKFKIFDDEKHGVAVTTGTLFFKSLNRGLGEKTYGLFYSNISKSFSRISGLRLTAGYYSVARVGGNFGSRKGYILGVEQHLKGKLNFAADWFTGKNSFGYKAVGLSYAFTKNQLLLAGYNFGNSGRGNNSFAAFYGITY